MTVGGGSLPCRELPRDERGASVARRRVLAEPGLRGDGVLVLAEHVLEARDRSGEPASLLADARCDGLGRVPAALRQDPHRVQRGVGRVVVELADRPLQLAPGLPHERGEVVGVLFVVVLILVRALRRERYVDGRVHETVEDREVPVGPQRAQQGEASRVPMLAQSLEQPLARVAIIVGALGEACLQPVAQHLGVAHVAEKPAEPLELVTDRVAPRFVQQGTERAEVRTESAGGDARLVDVFGVVAEAHARIVRDEPA